MSVLAYSPTIQQLSLERAGVIYTIGTGVLPEAYLNFNFHCNGTTLLVEDDSPVTANTRK